MLTLIEIIIGAVVLLGIIATILTKGGVFRSLHNKSLAAAEDLNEALRDPVADGRAAIAKAKEDIAAMQKQLKDLLVHIQEMKADRDQAARDVFKYETLAKSAGQAGNAADVQTALTFKLAAEKEVSDFDVEMSKSDKLATSIRAMIASQTAEVETAERDSKLLGSSLKHNDMRKKIAESVNDLEGTKNSLHRLRQDARRAQSEAEVSESESRTGTIAEDLESKYTSTASAISEETIAMYMKKSAETTPAS